MPKTPSASLRGGMAGDNLPVFDGRQGWAPLCAFLEVGIPDTEFPKTNSSREFNKDVLDKN